MSPSGGGPSTTVSGDRVDHDDGVNSAIRHQLWATAQQGVWPGLISAARGLALALLSLTANVVLFVLSVTSLALIPATARPHATDAPVGALTTREREVLALMAEGRSNAAIAGRLFITEKAISKHISNIFSKLGMPPSDDDNRRVLAVLTYLNA
jgi:DNA-binding NarL/FixJ family response regulator